MKQDYLKEYGTFKESHPVWGAWIETSFRKSNECISASRTPCGVRGLKRRPYRTVVHQQRRTPCGVRGLKLMGNGVAEEEFKSHPVWGAWIETTLEKSIGKAQLRRTPCGVRGLKQLDTVGVSECHRRTPCGVRGLKLARHSDGAEDHASHPVWGAWIETLD